MGALVVTLPLGGREVDATSLHPPGEPPLFVVNSDVPADRQRFTLGHELGHVACEPGDGLGPGGDGAAVLRRSCWRRPARCTPT